MGPSHVQSETGEWEVVVIVLLPAQSSTIATKTSTGHKQTRDRGINSVQFRFKHLQMVV